MICCGRQEKKDLKTKLENVDTGSSVERINGDEDQTVIVSFRSQYRPWGKKISLLFWGESQTAIEKNDCNEKLEVMKIEYIFYKFGVSVSSCCCNKISY